MADKMLKNQPHSIFLAEGILGRKPGGVGGIDE